MCRNVLCCLFLSALLAAPALQAGDWPQILGPHRDGVAVDETLSERWPASGPQEVWKVPVGQGFAGVAVVDSVVYVFHRRGNEEIVEARDAATGDIVWSRPFPCRYRGGYSSDSGPRCVPVVSGERVFVFGVEGALRCLQVSDGEEVWSRETADDFSAPDGYFGAGSSPVLYDGRVIVNVGGRQDAAVVAFSAADGETLWQSVDDAASYSSPIVTTVAGVDHALVVTRYHLVSLNPGDGAVRFRFPFGMRGPTVNGATPVVVDDHVFVSSSYRVGSAWASIGAGGDRPTRSGEELLATQYATPIQLDGLLYAVDGRQDMGAATVKCLDPAQQKVLWEQGGFDYGSMIRVGQELLFLTCGGELIRIAADSTDYRELDRATVLKPTPRGHRLPAISNGRLFVRDDSELKCLQVGAN